MVSAQCPLRPRTPAMTTDCVTRHAYRRWCRSAGLAVVAACVLATASCDRVGERDLDAEFDERRLAALTTSLNEHVARGDLTSFDTGRNDYAIRLPGSSREARFAVDLTERTVFVPFGFANVQLNGLRFVHADTLWDAARQALLIELDIQDTEDGVFAEVHTLAGVEDMAFFVSGGRVTV